MNLYPTTTLEARKGGTTALFDAVTAVIPEPSLGSILSADRVTRVWQGGTTYTAAPSTYVLTQTKGASGGTDVVASTLTVAASAADVLAVYQVVNGAATVYAETTQYTVILDNLGAGATLQANIDWEDGVQPAAGSSYVVVIEDASVDYTPVIDTSVTGKVTTNLYWGTISATVPTTGSSYFVKMRTEYPHDRKVITSADEAINTFGPIIDPTDPDFTDVTKINELSLAAYIAFSEGAPSLVLVPYDQVDLTYADALEFLATDDTVNIVAGIDDTYLTAGGTSLNDLVRLHVEDTSSMTAKKYRIGLMNPSVGDFSAAFDQTAETGYKAQVGICASQRIIMIGASQLDFSIPLSDGTYSTFRSDGGYGNIVYGAMMCRPDYDVATAMLRKPSRTIAKIRSQQDWDDKKLDMLAALGVTLFAKLDGIYKVRDDVTTDQTGTIMLMEPAITMISDNIAKTAIRVLDAAVIGGKLLLPTTLESIKTRLMSMLDSKTKNPTIIIGYGVPEVTVDTTDPRKILVVIPIQPVQKVREVLITFSYVSAL